MQVITTQQVPNAESDLVLRQVPVSRKLLMAGVILGLTCMGIFGGGSLAFTGKRRAERPYASVVSTTAPLAGDYSKFSHSSPKEHAGLMGRENCGSCHRRNDASTAPRFPLHKDCTGCHMVQFTAANSSSSVNPICTICHQAETLNSSSPPLKGFPRLMSFTAEFDHAQHLKGIESARPAKGCTACHTRLNRGVAETVPTRLGAHQICYECHTPGRAGNDSSSCGYCHKLGRYSPTSTTARAYRFAFSHADHYTRAHLNCDRCHNVLERGLAQRKQVSSIMSVQHSSNSRAQRCTTCHDGQRAFGDKGPKFDDCKRCHKGVTFGM